METYITMCKIESQREFAVSQETQTGLCINLEGWDGEGDGREVQREEIYVYLWVSHVEIGQKTKFCKAIILQLKIILYIKNLYMNVHSNSIKRLIYKQYFIVFSVLVLYLFN